MANDKGWKIYTRQGDKGETSLLGGSRVSKYHEKIEACGTLDELNAFIGLLRDQEGVCQDTAAFLFSIQKKIFLAESILSADSKESLQGLPEITSEDTKALEDAIDRMNTQLPELKNFIIPGGQQSVSYAHIARTVCRRAEREVLRANSTQSVDPKIMSYLNRLSDYFFVLSRHLSYKLKASEEKWTLDSF
ncbi:MAG: cob(I)yrinic acid a,c-diamide adenosyltransferase [Bacteroidales bacterium]